MDTEIKKCYCHPLYNCITKANLRLHRFFQTSPVQVPWMFRLQAWHQHRSYPSSLHQLTILTPPHLLCAKPETLRCLLETARRFKHLVPSALPSMLWHGKFAGSFSSNVATVWLTGKTNNSATKAPIIPSLW